MQLYATPLSHFSRKVRLLLDHYELAYEMIDVGNVANQKAERFAQNPLMKVPILIHQQQWIIDSDHIAHYIVEQFDNTDRYAVNDHSLINLNIRAILNGLMSEEVKLVLGRRTGIPIEQYAFFDKALESIQQSLLWLEEHANQFQASQPKYREFHLIAALEHLAYYNIIPLSPYPQLQSITDTLATSTVVQQSSPHSL